MALPPQGAADPLCELELPACGAILVGDTTVRSGETQSYEDRPYVVVGDITVEEGGTVVVERADFHFTNSSTGIRVAPGGTLEIRGGSFQPVGPHKGYVVELAPGAHLVLTDEAVLEGVQVVLASSSATIERVTFLRTPLALRLDEVHVVLTDVRIRYAEAGILQVGGNATMDQLDIQDTTTCVESRHANSTIRDSILARCAMGAVQEGGLGVYMATAMSDRADPDSIGMQLLNGASSSVSESSFTRWGTAIVVGAGSQLALGTGNHFADNVEDVRYV